MAINDLSADQLQIVESRVSHLMVQAQPGSGKTRILVERLLGYLRQRGGSDSRTPVFKTKPIVAITFTTKAAEEIKERISAELKGIYGDSVTHAWGMNQLWVSTIHGFCQRILSEHVWEAGLASGFSVLMAQEAFFLREKTIQGTLQRLTLSDNTSIVYLLTHYGFSKLKSLLLVLFDHPYALEDVRQQGNWDQASQECVRHLLHVFDSVFDDFQMAKRAQSVCDFDDLLWKCRALLKSCPDIRRKYRNQFRAILVDEFQDIDDLQREIIGYLTFDSGVNDPRVSDPRGAPRGTSSSVPSLMVVGDPKQSIYRFRGAQVQLFEETKQDILQKRGFCFEMVKNYRSHKTIIDFVNTLFEPLMTPYFLRSETGLDWKDSSHASGVEYWRRSDGDGKEALIPGGAEEGRVREALWLARHIKNFKKTRGSQTRGSQTRGGVSSEVSSPQWSHIAILFRAMTYSHLYEEALDEAGVPWIKSDGGYFHQNRDIEAFMALLKWVLNPQDDFSLWLSLSAPENGLEPNILWALGIYRAHYRCSLEEALRRCDTIETFSSDEKNKIRGVYHHLERLKRLKERISLEEWYLYYFLGDPLVGEDSSLRAPLTNTMKIFLKWVRNFERRNTMASWGDFVEYLEVLKSSSVRASEPLEEAHADAVRILTIHQAKGLEFDVVFVPDLGYMPRVEFGYLLIDKKLGLGLKTPTIPDDISHPKRLNQWMEDSIYQKIKENERQNELSESKRLFYVALTRARHRLILSQGSLKSRKNSWASYLDAQKSHLSSCMKERVFV